MSTTFLLTSLVIVATPGTGALFTIAAGISRGVRASMVAAFGCTLGIVPHLAAAVTGAAALLHASGVAFQMVKLAGVAYLLYTAWVIWHDKGSLSVDGDRTPRSAGRVILSAVLVNLLNPKLTIFFFAFLPQFVSAGDPHALGVMLGLSGVFMLMTFVVFAGYGILAASLRRQVLARPKAVQWVRRLIAASLAGLGAKLAVTAR